MVLFTPVALYSNLRSLTSVIVFGDFFELASPGHYDLPLAKRKVLIVIAKCSFPNNETMVIINRFA